MLIEPVWTCESRTRAVTYGSGGSSKADHAEVVEVQLSVVEVKPRGGEHSCGQRRDLEESTSHQRPCRRRSSQSEEVSTKETHMQGEEEHYNHLLMWTC